MWTSNLPRNVTQSIFHNSKNISIFTWFITRQTVATAPEILFTWYRSLWRHETARSWARWLLLGSSYTEDYSFCDIKDICVHGLIPKGRTKKLNSFIIICLVDLQGADRTRIQPVHLRHPVCSRPVSRGNWSSRHCLSPCQAHPRQHKPRSLGTKAADFARSTAKNVAYRWTGTSSSRRPVSQFASSLISLLMLWRHFRRNENVEKQYSRNLK